jgi:hypothetical protein
MVGLLERSGADLPTWQARIAERKPADERELRTYLEDQGLRGYAQMLLVFETFGYPEFFTKSADDLIAAQYEDRAHLRPALDAVTRPPDRSVTSRCRLGRPT